MTRGTILAALLAVTISACGTAAAGLSQERLQGIVDSWRESADVRGAVIGVTTPNGTLVAASGTSRDHGTDAPLEPIDRFDTFSISKVFTAVDVLLLEHEGLLALTDSASTHLPGLRLGIDITIEDLLRHRSGLVDYRSLPAFWEARLADLSEPWPAERAISYAIDHGPQSEPGTEYAYADTNYVLLARIVETVTGRSLASDLSARIFEPLDLVTTESRVPGTTGYVSGEVACDAVAGLTGQDDVPLVDALCIDGSISYLDTGLDPAFDRGASGVISTLDDLLRWAKALFGGATGIDVDAMLPTSGDEYGIGLMRIDTPLGTAYGHTGGGFGQARWWYVPSAEVAVVAWSTQEGTPNLDWLVDQVLRAHAGHGANSTDISSLIAALDHPEPGTRRAAAQDLANLGETSAPAASALVRTAMSDPDASVRAAAVFAVGPTAAGSNDADVISALAAILADDPSALVRRRAALALGLIGPDSLQVLEAAADSQPPDVQEAIGVAVARLQADGNP